MPAIPLKTSAREAVGELEQIIRSMHGSRIISSTHHYLHAEYRSSLLAFVDDVELYVDESERQIHFRSASRVGYSDMGTNRRRMEQIRQLYLAGETPSEGSER